MSTNNEYFVMLTTQPGGMTPMVNDDDELATFTSAKAAAQESVLGHHFGFEVFRRGEGKS